MMNYEEFQRRVVEEIGNIYQESIIDVNLMNGGGKGLVIREKGINASPILWLNDFYKEYLEHLDLSETIKNICDTYEEYKLTESIEVEELICFERCRKQIGMKLIRDKDIKNPVQIKYLDMVVCFYIDIMNDDTVCINIDKSILERWNISVEELFEIALENESKSEEEFFSMNTLLGIEEVEMLRPMFVLTNKSHIYGAKYLLFPNKLKNVWEKLQQDFYIIPSSINEVIIFPMNTEMEVEELEEMIREVNDTQLKENEILSYRAYKFTKDKQTVEFA